VVWEVKDLWKEGIDRSGRESLQGGEVGTKKYIRERILRGLGGLGGPSLKGPKWGGNLLYLDPAWAYSRQTVAIGGGRTGSVFECRAQGELEKVAGREEKRDRREEKGRKSSLGIGVRGSYRRRNIRARSNGIGDFMKDFRKSMKTQENKKKKNKKQKTYLFYHLPETP